VQNNLDEISRRFGVDLPPSGGVHLPGKFSAIVPVNIHNNFDRPRPDPAPSGPLGTSPDGHLIVCVKELPVLPAPSRVIVHYTFIDIDGWVFPYSAITRGWLIWAKRSFERWHQADPTAENQRWITAIVSAFEQRLGGTRRE